MTDWLAAMRREHAGGALTDADAQSDPFEQFRIWLHDAHGSGMLHPNAMTLSTIDPAGRPDGRIVLLKGFDERGFVFYTHRTSLKGRQLAANPRAAELVKLRYFVGFSNAEAASLLGISPRKADQVWAYARAWLREEIGDGEGA